MTDELNNDDTPTTVSVEEYNKLKEDFEKVLAKKDEALGETKTERAKRRELEQRQDDLEKAALKEKEDFKTLFERSEKERTEWESKFTTFEKQIVEKEVDSFAYKVSATLTKDVKRAEMLAKETKQFIEYTPEGAKFVIGGIEVSQEQVTKHLSESYPFLVDSLGASGGGAIGSSNVPSGSKKGDFGGSTAERKAAIQAKFNL